jgi:hypothetical protein
MRNIKSSGRSKIDVCIKEITEAKSMCALRKITGIREKYEKKK